MDDMRQDQLRACLTPPNTRLLLREMCPQQMAWAAIQPWEELTRCLVPKTLALGTASAACEVAQWSLLQ